jgi:hypothetical protein
MPLQLPTIKKLFREHFSGNAPLRVDPEKRQQFGEEICRRLERIDGVDTKNHYVGQAEQDRHVCSFSISDPEHRQFYYSRNEFRLIVGENQDLLLKHGRDASQALVSSLDELEEFVLACRQRLLRRKALETRRQKVRELKTQAVLAQVKKLGRELQFDFKSEADAQKIRLFVRLSDAHSVELAIPFKEFERTLPQLRNAICSLRELYESGIRFKIVGRAGLPWRAKWVSYKDES